MDSPTPDAAGEPAVQATEAELARLHDDLREEYYRLAGLVEGFDQRLLTIKGWGVTLGLASLGFGFEKQHYGLFLVAALSGLAFWVVEATTKSHQMRFYPRMRDIEVIARELFGTSGADGRTVSSPLIDWSWTTGRQRLWGGDSKGDPGSPQRHPDQQEKTGRLGPLIVLFYPHVFMPHLLTVLAGAVLFAIGLSGSDYFPHI